MKNARCPRLSMLILALISALILTDCKDDPSIEPVTVQWEKDPAFDNSFGLMNASRRNDELNVLSSSVYFKDISPSSNSSLNYFRTGPYTGAGRFKFPATAGHYILTDLDKVVIRSANTVEIESTETAIDLKLLDPTFSQLEDIPWWQSECIGNTADGFILVPYHAVKDGHGVPTPYFLLARVTATDNVVTVEEKKLIQEDIVMGSVSVYTIQSFFNSFFVWMGGHTYKIDVEGSIKQVFDKGLNIFQSGDDLLAFARDFNAGNVDLYRSDNGGDTWSFVTNIDAGFLVDLHYCVINDRVVGYTKAQIFEIAITDHDYTITELDNEGLSLADITSISMADDQTVFITTLCNDFSDVCGGYFKPLKYFFDKKKQE
jgi:hypothetical protein